jgi:hypothetical protein
MKEGYDTYFWSRERGTFHIVMLLCEDSEEEVILINNLEGENTGNLVFTTLFYLNMEF